MVVTLAAADHECASNRWLDEHPSTPEICMALIRASSVCNLRFFNYAIGGDRNCGCVEDVGSSCTSTVTRDNINIYHVSQAGGTAN